MSEDQIIVIASKPFDGEARTRIAHVASLRDNLKILTNKGVSEHPSKFFKSSTFLCTQNRVLEQSKAPCNRGRRVDSSTDLRHGKHKMIWISSKVLMSPKSSISTAQNQETAANTMRRQKVPSGGAGIPNHFRVGNLAPTLHAGSCDYLNHLLNPAPKQPRANLRETHLIRPPR